MVDSPLPLFSSALRLRKGLLAAACLAAVAARAGSVSCDQFAAELDPAFPGLVSWTYGGQRVALPPAGARTFLLNGAEYTPEVRFAKTSANTAEYHLEFKDLAVTMRLRCVAGRDSLAFTLDPIDERGTTMVRTIEIPGLVLLAGAAGDEAALGNFPAASYASENPEDHDIIAKVGGLAKAAGKGRNKTKDGHQGASYAFVSNGKVAGGLFTNVLEEDFRMIARLGGSEGAATLAVAPGKWTWREVPFETVAAPQATLVVAADRNGDGQATWQDAALAYRDNTPQPYGAELTPRYPVTHIAMNFASQATNPFLRVLDNAKKVWLLTDGLGQRIQYKGFQSEGHDSSHPDYAGNVGRRMGGRDDLNFAQRRGHDFNILSGVHINAHEYHKEAKAFQPSIVNLGAIGWSWLDESFLTDYRYDPAYGTLYPRLEAMRADLPWLDFVYLDVYYGRGWPGWKMHTKTNSLGIIQFTEFPGTMERAVVWNHVANDWTQAVWGKGDRSAIARFIHYSAKDTFRHDPLLRGTNCDGFMGWHAEQDMTRTIRSAFTVNLPTKYLQHFPLRRQEAGLAWFGGGVRSEVEGQVAKLFGRDGQLVDSCRYEGDKSRPADNLVFLPWDPIGEGKIYHWNDKGGDSTWTLPRSWDGVTAALLYRLTDLGRVFEREVAVAQGKVTLAGIAAATPYVLYREAPPALPDMRWGEGGLVRDPGFDSHSFDAWQPTAAAEGIAIANNAFGQTELVMRGPGEVAQTIAGLKPGRMYAASVWVNVGRERETTLAVRAAPPAPPPFVDKQAWRVTCRPAGKGGDKPQKMLDGAMDTAWVSPTADPKPGYPHEITLALDKEYELEGFQQTARANDGEGRIAGFKAATSLDGKSWRAVAAGRFEYGPDGRAAVRFARPAKAKFFRLTAVSGVKEGPVASCAELDLVVAADRPASAAAFAGAAATVRRTDFPNFTDTSSKYTARWHRLKVVFVAPATGRAALALAAGAGEGEVRFDDVRVVPTAVSKAPAGAGRVVCFEDFENVDEGWGPFVYGWKGPMNTHLSEANPPYTDDTIGGRYSLKSRLEGSPGLLYRTVPATLALKPSATYRVTFDYLCDKAGCFALAAGTDEKDKPLAVTLPLPDGSWKVRKFTGTIRTDARDDWFLGITKTDPKQPGIIVIDNFLVEEEG